MTEQRIIRVLLSLSEAEFYLRRMPGPTAATIRERLLVLIEMTKTLRGEADRGS